ncbi:hypothetical protein [Paenibacillus gorillae]|uniref:hypothetical protein n=1 Tax=Paenibacillus gorillae TaxID=1243662 RepID=UPI0004B653EF|nr:hypothetical protein [Paenibacillus gorillae]
MVNYLRSERGGTLLMAFGFIVVMALIITPLAASTSTGLLQVKTNGNTEVSFNRAESAMMVFDQMYGILKANNTNPYYPYSGEDIVKLVDSMQGMKSELGIDNIVLIEEAGIPTSVVFYAHNGEGNQKRSSKVSYSLTVPEPVPIPTVVPTPAPTPTPVPTVAPTPTPSPSPTAPAIGGDRKVIMNNTTFNNLYCECAPNPVVVPTNQKKFIENNYPGGSAFESEFGVYADYYLKEIFKSKTEAKLAAAQAISNTVTERTNLVKTASATIGPYAGHVELQQADRSRAMIVSPKDGYAVKSAGNLSLWRHNDSMTLDGKTNVGGNLEVQEVSGKVVFKGDVYVRGNTIVGTGGNSKEIVVEGDLVINGDFEIRNSIGKFTVLGDLIVGGKLTAANTVSDSWTVKGSMLVKGNISFGSSLSKFEVMQNFIAKGSVDFTNKVEELIVGGSIAIQGSFINQSGLSSVTVGKDFIVRGDFVMKNNIKPGGISMSGYFIVFGNATFKEISNSKGSGGIPVSKMKGFMVGGNTVFEDYMKWQNFDNVICIL